MRQRLYTKTGYSPKDALTGGRWMPDHRGIQRWVPEVSPASVDRPPLSVAEIVERVAMEKA